MAARGSGQDLLRRWWRDYSLSIVVGFLFVTSFILAGEVRLRGIGGGAAADPPRVP